MKPQTLKPSLHELWTRSSLILALAIIPWAASAQLRSTIGILDIEAQGVIPSSSVIGGMVRLEMEKVGLFDILDWHGMRDMLSQEQLDINTCFGRNCAIEAGKLLKADKMLFGSVDRFGERIAISLKIVNVSTGMIEAANTSEYANIQQEMQRMIEISVKRILGIEPDKKLSEQLAVYDQPIESKVGKANLSGPRMGCYFTDGIAGERMRADKIPYGGLGMSKITSMIGWQQEVQYISSGNFQCLLEFLFTGAGLESGRFIPSFTFLNGFRLNKEGWEVALGPTFRLVKMAEGYYQMDENGNFDPVKDWHLRRDWDPANGNNPFPIVENLDHRGDLRFSAALVFALGKTFRSGQLNIPLNAYVIPRKEGSVYGMSVGFNVFKSSAN